MKKIGWEHGRREREIDLGVVIDNVFGIALLENLVEVGQERMTHVLQGCVLLELQDCAPASEP